MALSSRVVSSPFGPLTLFAVNGRIVSLDWGKGCDVPAEADSPVLALAAEQLAAYFEERLKVFSLPLEAAGTPFQKRVWDALCAIPYGEVQTYGELAAGLSSSARAVGGACGANPIPILIPCHRAVGSGGHLTGYSGMGGIFTKRRLLRLENPRLQLNGED